MNSFFQEADCLADAPCGTSSGLSVPPVVPSFPSLASLCHLDPADHSPSPAHPDVVMGWVGELLLASSFLPDL